MTQAIIYIIGLLIIGGLLGYVIVKYVPLKLKPLVNLVLLALTILFSYNIYKSIYGPVKFNQIKVKRYKKIVAKLKDIRNVELAHREITGDYAGNFDSLVRFVDTAKYVITQQRDSSYKYFDKAYGIEKDKDTILIDTLGYVPVKDSLFKNSNRYKTMMFVPIPGKEKQVKFELKTGYVTKSNVKVPVFRVRVDKSLVLYDQEPDLVAQEKTIKSTKEINGGYIQVGSLDEVKDSGNWPKLYDIDENK